MKNITRTIVTVLTVLITITAIGAGLNRQYARENLALLKAAEIKVLENQREAARLNLETINQLSTSEFTAYLKSSLMTSPEKHIYTGVALAKLFDAAGISLEGRKKVVVRSVDGYAVPLTIEEIQMLDNIFLVYKDNGNFLGGYGEAGGQGPYMIVVKGDSFSQRWAKYVCELDIQ